MDSELVWGGGLHAGEFGRLVDELTVEWLVPRMMVLPMLGVEYVARRVDGMHKVYRYMQETAWAMVSEAFSNKVIQAGKTTTHVS